MFWLFSGLILIYLLTFHLQNVKNIFFSNQTLCLSKKSLHWRSRNFFTVFVKTFLRQLCQLNSQLYQAGNLLHLSDSRYPASDCRYPGSNCGSSRYRAGVESELGRLSHRRAVCFKSLCYNPPCSRCWSRVKPPVAPRSINRLVLEPVCPLAQRTRFRDSVTDRKSELRWSPIELNRS